MKAATYTGELRMLLAVVAVTAVPLVLSAMSSPPVERRPAARSASPIVLIQPMVIEMARPRALPSGAPACGNVTARIPYRGPR